MNRWTIGIAVLALVAGTVFLTQKETGPVFIPAVDAVSPENSVATASEDPAPSNPVRITTQPITVAEPSVVVPAPNQSSVRGEVLDISQLGTATLSDGDFNSVVASIGNEPALLEQILLEYRANTDPARAFQLAKILAQFDAASIITLGQEMVFSGDIASQKAGLDLLGGQQPRSSEARDIIAQVLEAEVNPEVLVSALNALAIPGTAEPEQQQRLLQQFFTHASGDDPVVRHHSLDLMSRWAGDANLNEYYLHGLSDPDERVRNGALFALIDTKYPDGNVKQALVGVVENSSLTGLRRTTALEALRRYGLTAEDRTRYETLISGN